MLPPKDMIIHVCWSIEEELTVKAPVPRGRRQLMQPPLFGRLFWFKGILLILHCPRRTGPNERAEDARSELLMRVTCDM